MSHYTFGQWFIVGALAFKGLAGIAFASVYGAMAKWYKSPVGRQIMFLTLSLIMFPIYVVAISIFPPGTHFELVRVMMGIAIIPTGIALVVQTVMVYRVQRKKSDD
jgi:ABC-type glycerol-3-phosphate transport system permease component